MRNRLAHYAGITLAVVGATVVVLFVTAYLYVYQRSNIWPRKKRVLTSAERRAACYNRTLVDTAVQRLRSGELVLRMGRGADSYLLCQFNTRDKSYSHCGIVMVEDGYPFVYHCIGGEDNPDERLRRDSASHFFSPAENLAIAIVDYGFDSDATHRLGAIARSYYERCPRFDLKFDLRTDDELYCAEFVYKALNQTMHDSSFIRTTTLAGQRFVGVDALFNNGHSSLVWQTQFK